MDRATPKEVFQANRERAAPLLDPSGSTATARPLFRRER
jgi:hypothetical protein